MKLCFVARAGSIHTQKWVTYFAGRGHEVHLLDIEPLGDLRLPGVQLHSLRSPARLRPAAQLAALLQLRAAIRQIGPDVLHAHYVVDYGVGAALTGFHPFVLTAWGSDILVAAQRSALVRWRVSFALRRADCVTCDAEHLAARMAQLGAARDTIRLVYFGVDTRRFSPGQGDGRLRAQLQPHPAAPIVISLRNLEPLYDVETLIRAAPRVLAEVPETAFVVAGSGEQRPELEALAAALGVAGAVRFVGAVPNAELPRYLACSDVYVSTALSDGGLAASTAEAMACQLPVVITDFGNNDEWVEDGEGGFLIPARDPALLAERVILLLKDAALRRRFGEANRRVICRRNDYHTEMARMETIYQALRAAHP